MVWAPISFFTFAPNDVDNVLTLRLSMGTNAIDVALPDTSKRFAALSRNPAAAARIFERQVQTFMTVLLGFPPAQDTKKGKPVVQRTAGIRGNH